MKPMKPVRYIPCIKKIYILIHAFFYIMIYNDLCLVLSRLCLIFFISVAWFTYESSHPDVTISATGFTVSCDSYEHRVVLGSVGFSRGAHYWEYTLERYDGNADIAFGLGRIDICKEMILGK